MPAVALFWGVVAFVVANRTTRPAPSLSRLRVPHTTVVAVEAMISEIRSYYFVVKPNDSKKIQEILKVNEQIK